MSEISRTAVDIIGSIQAELVELRSLSSQQATQLAKLNDGHRNAKKLSAKDVNRLRGMYRNGSTQAELAQVFDLNPATVSRTVRGLYHRNTR